MGSRMGLIGCLIVVVALLNGATAQVTSAAQTRFAHGLKALVFSDQREVFFW
jgi:hypothetical protein